MGEHQAEPEGARPVYLRIADDLRKNHSAGVRLPSTAQLSERWGVARETVRAAIDVLRSEGLVSSWPGRGVYYEADLPSEDETSDPVLARLDAVMERLDAFEARLAAVERAISG
ncbi:winged helix-turn-helix domain-containing protein [Nocardia farcinica]|uniref:winged helix-turn-helix domain-containing protein n=1 Tax=Nocardia farcinica TaxID=37329 RepID=UPI0018931390|nr:winged helix-turn-helix domain-containing protein [Nocardia farcinica]MBF6444590.1 winged helix-turn-helix transcriptional regulator [Nocardia farcinica]